MASGQTGRIGQIAQCSVMVAQRAELDSVMIQSLSMEEGTVKGLPKRLPNATPMLVQAS